MLYFGFSECPVWVVCGWIDLADVKIVSLYLQFTLHAFCLFRVRRKQNCFSTFVFFSLALFARSDEFPVRIANNWNYVTSCEHKDARHVGTNTKLLRRKNDHRNSGATDEKSTGSANEASNALSKCWIEFDNDLEYIWYTSFKLDGARFVNKWVWQAKNYSTSHRCTSSISDGPDFSVVFPAEVKTFRHRAQKKNVSKTEKIGIYF